MSDGIIQNLEQETAAEKKETAVQMAKKKAKIVDEGKVAKFETRQSYQNQYTGCTGIITERNTFGLDQSRKEQIAREITRLQIEESQPVKGIFHNRETPGGSAKFPYRAYRGEPLAMYEMKDGKEYTIPLGLARHLRHRCSYPVRGWAVDENNLASHTTTRRMVKRFMFEYTDSFDPRDQEIRLKTEREFDIDVIPKHLGSVGGR